MATPCSTAQLELRLLGELQVTVNGAPLGGKLYGKALALLAYLAVEFDRAHSRESLADLFWPNLPSESARTNLRQALYHLRRAFGGHQVLVVERERVRFSPSLACWVDINELRTPPWNCERCQALGAPNRCPSCLQLLEHLSTLYRGPFLQDIEIDDAPDFQQWRLRWQESLHREALALHEALRAAYEQRGELVQAIEHAKRYVELEPWDEEGHRQLMRLLALSGRRAAALAHYEHCRAMLARELDAEPEEATQALARAIEDDKLAPQDTIQRRRERRPATVLALTFEPVALHDPEIIAERLRELRRRAMLLAQRAGAHVVQSPDGGLIAYFGYPIAYDDAGRRAVRSAVDIVADTPSGCVLRAGVHTGLIVIHDDAAFPDASGRAPAAAVRLAALAQPGEVVVDEPTRRLVERDFSLYSNPGSGTYTVSRDEITKSTLPPLTGRTTELQWLQRRWEQALSGTLGAVLVRGEAGLGKSRLVQALRDRIAVNGASVRKLHCYAQYQGTPLRPIITLVEEAYGISAEDNPQIRLGKLTDGLKAQRSEKLSFRAEVLRPLLAAREDEPAALSAGRKQQLFSVLLELLDGLARGRPLLLIVEDVHWADPSSLELLELYSRRRMPLPALLVLTARSHFHLPWVEEAAILDLAPLEEAELRRLVVTIAPGLSAQTVADIVAHADGVPLLAEELARGAADPEGTGIPLSLSFLIQARLDALGEAGRTAQLAAVLGRRFDRELLARINDPGAGALDGLLARLEAARLIVPVREGYEFRHALIHEAVRATLLQSDAREIHALIARTLVEQLPGRAARGPEQVAHHFTAAGALEEAVPWWLEAGKRALSVLACAEAAAHLQRGRRLLARLTPNKAKKSRQLELLLTLGQALLVRDGYGSPEAAEVFERAFGLCREASPSSERFQALAGLWMVSSSQQGYVESQRLADALLNEARALRTTDLRAMAHAAAANIAMWRGELERSCRHAWAAIRLGRSMNRSWVGISGYEARITSLAHLSWARHAQGCEEAALEAGSSAVETARALDDPYSLCFALLFAATLRRFRGEVEAAVDHALEADELARRHRMPLWMGAAGLVLGWADVCRGDSEGLKRLQSAVDALRSAMPSVVVAGLHALADAQGVAEDFTAQLATVEAALNTAAALDEHFHEADLHRMRGAALLRLGRRKAAQAAFGKARSLAKAQGARAVLRRLSAA